MNPQVSLSTVISWTAIAGATSYELTAQNSTGSNILTPNVDVGNVLTASVSTWLLGSPPATGYQLFVRAKNATESGPWGQLNVDLIASLTAPVLSVA